MDYYLYSHSNADGIFYIGKGCGDRVKHKHLASRSAEWHGASKDGYTSKIEANGTEADILSLERIVIKSLLEQGVNLVNKRHNPNWDGQRGENNPMFGKVGDKNPFFGKTHSDKTKKKISEIGKKNKGNKRPDLTYYNRKRAQHYRLAKANNYRRTL